MFKKKELTRLGDILVSKGLITPTQLDLAIKEQSRRKRLLDPSDTAAVVTPIGEILIELGFIDRLQLKRGLNWQQRLRHASIAMALCAPFMIFSPSAAASVVRPAPITVEAENYSAMKGIQTESSTDIGGGKNVGYIDASDWMTYSNIQVPATGTYKITYRVASPNGGGNILLKNESTDATLDSVPIPKTGGWQTWVDVERTVSLSQGSLNLKLLVDIGGFNFNWFKIESMDGAVVTSSSSSSSAAPLLSTVIQAETYHSGAGIQAEVTTDTGGGKNLGYIDSSDWMTYNNILIPASGVYKITYRVASPNGGGSILLKNESTNATLDTVPIPKTGGWQTWADVERTVNLSQGSLNLKMLVEVGGFNFNWFKIESADGTLITSGSSSSASPILASTETKFPFVIQAESYSAMAGVQKETTTDVGGGQNVGYIDTGDWMSYSNAVINAPFTGKYKISYRVASSKGGAVLALSDITTNTTIDSVPVPNTGGWQAWTTVEREVTLTAGEHKFTLVAATGGVNLNWIQIEPVSTPMPLTVEAESYSEMSGVKNETASGDGGGTNVGYIDTGDWMHYNNTEVLIPNTATYKVTYRVASERTGSTIQLYAPASGAIFDNVTVPNTAGWQKWTSVERIVTLPAGKHYFGVKALVGGFNLNWIKLEPADQASNPISPPPVGSTTSSSSSSSTPAVSSSSSSKPAVSSSSWSSSSSAANTQHVAGPVGISWTAPNKRENGEYLDVTDLGGYEIRYKKSSDSKFTYISINDAWTTSYNFPWLEGDYVFQIAAFDKNGVYSPFVDILRQ